MTLNVHEEKRGYEFLPQSLLKEVPPLYAQEGRGLHAIAHLHYFTMVSDWYITEIDPDNLIAFGWAQIQPSGGEWGYISLTELESMSVTKNITLVADDKEHIIPAEIIVERDVDWTPRKIREAIGENSDD